LGTPTFVNGVLRSAEAARNKAIEGKQDPSWLTASLRLCVTGAEKTPDHLYAFGESHDPPIKIIEGYGITETSPVLTANLPGKPRAGVGWPVAKSTIALIDLEAFNDGRQVKLIATSDGNELKGDVDKRVLICANGPCVFGDPGGNPPSGYLGIPLTEKNPYVFFKERWWYETGDLGTFDNTGALYLAGRLKRFVKIAGEMVSLVSLEAALKQRVLPDGSHPWADKDSGPVLAVEGYEAGEKPVLALVTAVDASLDDANDQLREAGMPKIAKLTFLLDSRAVFDAFWAQQGTLPLLGTGKTDYASVKKALAAALGNVRDKE
jgi:long-chain-fatty-acid--[acyl-carrier-protein] ligase